MADPNRNVCSVCLCVFQDQKTLGTHILTCTPNPNDSTKSFFNHWRGPLTNKDLTHDQQIIDTEKVLPMSQPLYLGENEDIQSQEATMVEDVQFKVDIPCSQRIENSTQQTQSQSHNSEDTPCSHYVRLFKTRGLNKHKNSCKKKAASF